MSNYQWPPKRACYFKLNGVVYQDGMKTNKGEYFEFTIQPNNKIGVSVGNALYRSLTYTLCDINDVEDLVIGK